MNETQRILVINNYLRDNNIELLNDFDRALTNDMDKELQILESISQTFLLSKWNNSDISELDGLNNFLQENFKNIQSRAKTTLLEIGKDIYEYLEREYPNYNLDNLNSTWGSNVLDWCMRDYIVGSWLIDSLEDIDESFEVDFGIE